MQQTHPKHYCGVFGIYGHPNAAELTYYGLYALQHRGQESAGIVTSDGSQFRVHRGMGLVPQIFTGDALHDLVGKIAIGHTRYSTTGSSHLRMPAVLNWFTGHIGLHHVHHLGPKIPNYRLKRAHEENPIFAEAPVLTLKTAWRTLRLTLWDEANGRMIGFRELRQLTRTPSLQQG